MDQGLAPKPLIINEIRWHRTCDWESINHSISPRGEAESSRAKLSRNEFGEEAFALYQLACNERAELAQEVERLKDELSRLKQKKDVL